MEERKEEEVRCAKRGTEEAVFEQNSCSAVISRDENIVGVVT